MTGLEIDYVTLLPALVPIGGAVLVLVADLIRPSLRRIPFAIAGLAVVASGAATVPGLAQVRGDAQATLCLSPRAPDSGSGALPSGVEGLPRTCFWQADSLTSSLQLAAAIATLVVVLLAWPRARTRADRDGTGEPIEAILLLVAFAGTVVVAASRDLGTWLIALELATLPVIALIALSGRRGAVAGAVQLLVTSLVSFALLVLGAALWLVATGTPMLDANAALLGEGYQVEAIGAGAVAWPDASSAILALAVVLIIAGLGFKLSLVPFHAWTPTAYAGASVPVATFLATVSKLGALAALLVVLRAITVVGASALAAIALLAVLSMTVGNIMALRQHDVVRLLAWSTVAQAGWVVLPLVSVSSLGNRAAGTYLLTYVVATAVAFAVVALMLRDRPGSGRTLDAYEGLWHRRPWRAGALALALTSLAGLPPGIIGLVGKIVALRPVVVEGWIWLAVIAAANAVLGVAVYLRWLRPVVTTTEESAEVLPATRGPGSRRAIIAGLVIGSALLVVVSVQPDVLLRLLG
ncbi:NADH-quinone oxidoreductase subunit N [Intrasporangium sp.]|uniref:NADH-quinone oxidoreductase subunit N n=1 Tax=Intrasporangium sp. TaxID=1925024 RepID=UPI00293A1CC6|nr:NADH-quinone oxidoreductase subunit N [Intrasporangium sp.]MDV3220726.1 NADH-quinone oxidoreductase subunit N [Intrasporangium sp.]